MTIRIQKPFYLLAVIGDVWYLCFGVRFLSLNLMHCVCWICPSNHLIVYLLLQLLVNRTLYEKTLASGFGSVYFLLDASQQQQVMQNEGLLPHFVLIVFNFVVDVIKIVLFPDSIKKQFWFMQFYSILRAIRYFIFWFFNICNNF